MRAFFIIHELALNGAVTALLQQVRRLRARGDRVTVATPDLAGPASALLPQFLAAGAEIVRSIDWTGHDVVVGCTVFAAPLMRDCAGRVPTAWWIHEAQAGVLSLAGKPEALRTLSRVNKLIFPTRAVAERAWHPLIGGLPPGRIEIVPCFVPPPPADAQPLPRRPDRARVLCVGSVYPRKRQVDLVRAVNLLKNARLDCVLVGDGNMLEPPGGEIVRADPERFTMAGGQPPETIHRWYRSAEIFCLPSADESLGLAPIEAAWHGLPVVLSDLECYHGIWRHGVNAMIYPAGDVEMLAWYLRILMESANIRRRIGEAARAVPLRFSEQRSGALFDAALNEAIATFRPQP